MKDYKDISEYWNTQKLSSVECGKLLRRFIKVAIKKQIPKKPTLEYFDEYESEHLCCPNCKEILTDRIPGKPETFYFHCMNCGQKLDWGDSDES